MRRIVKLVNGEFRKNTLTDRFYTSYMVCRSDPAGCDICTVCNRKTTLCKVSDGHDHISSAIVADLEYIYFVKSEMSSKMCYEFHDKIIISPTVGYKEQRIAMSSWSNYVGIVCVLLFRLSLPACFTWSTIFICTLFIWQRKNIFHIASCTATVSIQQKHENSAAGQSVPDQRNRPPRGA